MSYKLSKLTRLFLLHNQGAVNLTGTEVAVLYILAEAASDSGRYAYQAWDCDQFDLAKLINVANLKFVLRGLAAKGLDIRVQRGTDKAGRPVFAHRGMQMTYQVPEKIIKFVAPDAVVAPPFEADEGAVPPPISQGGAMSPPEPHSGGSDDPMYDPFGQHGGAVSPPSGAVSPPSGAVSPPSPSLRSSTSENPPSVVTSPSDDRLAEAEPDVTVPEDLRQAARVAFGIGGGFNYDQKAQRILNDAEPDAPALRRLNGDQRVHLVDTISEALAGGASHGHVIDALCRLDPRDPNLFESALTTVAGLGALPVLMVDPVEATDLVAAGRTGSVCSPVKAEAIASIRELLNSRSGGRPGGCSGRRMVGLASGDAPEGSAVPAA